MLIVFLSVSSYLHAKYCTPRADCLTEPLAVHVSEGFQALQHVLRGVHGAILITGRKETGNP